MFNIDKYIRVVADITEYRIVSKLIFLRIIISKFMLIWQNFHVKTTIIKAKLKKSAANITKYYIIPN